MSLPWSVGEVQFFLCNHPPQHGWMPSLRGSFRHNGHSLQPPASAWDGMLDSRYPSMGRATTNDRVSVYLFNVNKNTKLHVLPALQEWLDRCAREGGASSKQGSKEQAK